LKGTKARRRAMLALGLKPDEPRAEFIFSEMVKGQLLKCPGCGAIYWALDRFYDHMAWHEWLMLEKGFRARGSREPESRPWSMMRQLVLLRDVGKCRVEGCYSRERPEVHHIVPREKGGSNSFKNLVTICYIHHRRTLQRAKLPKLVIF
jgi:hypothetical protein